MPDEHSRLADEGVFKERERKSVFLPDQIYNANVFLWQIGEQAVLNQLLPPHTQASQDCISHAWAVALQDWTLCKFGGWLGEVSTEVLYGGSRVQIGNNKLKQPGSCCAWVAAFITRFGVLPRAVYGNTDLSHYNAAKVDDFGEHGVPADLLDQLHKIPGYLLHDDSLIHIAKLKSGQDAWEAVGDKLPVPFASRRGFQTKRGPNGICDPVGIWNHSMVVRGRCTVQGGRKCLAVQNSAGDYLGDTNQLVTLDDNTVIKLPAGVFLTELAVFDDICKTEDAYTVF